MNNRLNTIQKERRNKYQVWMDIKFYMVPKHVDQHLCKQKVWLAWKCSITMNTIVKVEVTDKLHQMPIYKEIWTWIDMPHNMVNSAQVQSTRSENGVVRSQKDQSPGLKQKSTLAFLVHSHHLEILKILRKWEIDLNMRNSWLLNINSRTENLRKPMSNLLAVWETMKRSLNKWN